jgi:NADH-quinone oxidoreductase subunit I
MASIFREVGETFSTLVQGFSVTFRNMFRKTVTENYPFEPVHFQPRYRGIHVLHRDESGLEKCVGCFLCAAACPANCIYIEAAENTDASRISAGERYASVVFSAATASKPAPRMRLRMDTVLNSQHTTSIP